MDQLICPNCSKPAGFTVTEQWPPTTYTVSSDRDAVDEGSNGQRDFEITCDACGNVPNGDLWEEIYELSQG